MIFHDTVTAETKNANLRGFWGNNNGDGPLKKYRVRPPVMLTMSTRSVRVRPPQHSAKRL